MISGDWAEPVLCPACGSENTRFVEPRYEGSIYECMDCGSRFETDQ